MASKPNSVLVNRLNNAHRGYLYQDIAVAYLLAIAHYEDADSVLVDVKEHHGDLFDDVTIVKAGRKIKRQIKSSANVHQSFGTRHIVSDLSSIRLDDIIRSFSSASDKADEYRLCCTWSKPQDEEMISILNVASTDSSIPYSEIRCFELVVNAIWPENGDLAVVIEGFDQSLTRDDLVNFAAHFVIETNWPQISGDLLNPGPLEELLLTFLTDKIGIGHYPNQRRVASDVAASLILVANRARISGRLVNPRDIAKEIGLRTDFGRVAQIFPIDQKRQIGCHAIEQEITKHATQDGLVLLTGPPGAGKSWTLTKIAEDIEKLSCLVTTHYCHISPIDDLATARITINTMYGNLVAGLIEKCPELQRKKATRYSGDRGSLIELVRKALEETSYKRIVFVIDGLDHIERVFTQFHGVERSEIGLVDEIASFPLIEGLTILLGSQPGQHCSVLISNARTLDMPVWGIDEIKDYIQKCESQAAAKKTQSSCGDVSTNQNVILALQQKSEGNPLYLTYLCRQLNISSSTTEATIAGDIDLLPVFGGDINNYYRYLLGTPSSIARLLGYVDFSVTENDLREIFPLIGPEIESQLKHLQPVLTHVAAQGGYRIYHESFRRFIASSVDTLEAESRTVLLLVIEWLLAKGFYQDARSYRFLLRYIQRVGDVQRLTSLVPADFLIRSVANGFSESAIWANVICAAEVAASSASWNLFMRVLQFQKALTGCFDYNSIDYFLLGESYGSIYGFDKLNEKLLLDGRPTYPREQGLRLCSLCADAGFTPPWEEYLSLYNQGNKNEDVFEFHGRVALVGAKEAVREVETEFRAIERIGYEFFNQMCLRVYKSAGVLEGFKILRRAFQNSNAQLEILLTAGEISFQQQNFINAKRFGKMALSQVSNLEGGVRIAKLGASAGSLLPYCSNFEVVTSSIWSAKTIRQAEMSGWLNCVELLARADKERLRAVAKQLNPYSWFQHWMIFVIGLFDFRARKEEGLIESDNKISTLLSLLASMDEPFLGNLRSCDLHEIQGEILGTFEITLSLISSSKVWYDCINSLMEICKNHTTTTNFLGPHPDGPLTNLALSKLLLSFANTSHSPDVVWEKLEQLSAEAEEFGYFYYVHAELEIRKAVFSKMVGNVGKSEEHWSTACALLLSYSSGREPTIFELIECLPSLAKEDRAKTKECFERLYPLLVALDEHAPGKATKNALHTWFENLINVDLEGALQVLAQSLKQLEKSWRIDECLTATRKVVAETFDTSIGLLFLQQFPIYEYDLPSRLVLLEKVVRNERDMVEADFKSIYLELSNKTDNEIIKSVRAFARRNGFSCSVKNSRKRKSVKRSKKRRKLTSVFGRKNTVGEVIRKLGELDSFKGEKRADQKFIQAEICWILLVFLRRDDIEGARRILHFFAREYFIDKKGKFLAKLASEIETFGCLELAAETYVLAYIHTWSKGGWLVMGDSDQFNLLLRAFGVMGSSTWRFLLEKVHDLWLAGGRGYANGITQHLLQICSQLPTEASAIDAWNEAFGALKLRLPTVAQTRTEIVPYSIRDLSPLSKEQCLAFVLLRLLIKKGTLNKSSSMISANPDWYLPAIQDCLQLNTPIHAMVGLFNILQLLPKGTLLRNSMVMDLIFLYSECKDRSLKMKARELLASIKEHETK